MGRHVAQERVLKCADIAERTLASGVEKFVGVWAGAPGPLKDASRCLQASYCFFG